MTKYHPEKVKFHPRSGEELSNRIGRYLRQKHPYKTAESVAAETGISSNTIASWLKGMSVPGGAAIGQLLQAYGLEFLSSAYPGLAGIEAALKLMHRDTLARQLDQADHDLADTFDMLRGRR